MIKNFRIIFMLLVCSLISGCQPSSKKAAEKEIITTPNAPAAIGPYSQAIKIGNTLYCSGQIAIDPGTGNLVTDTIENETKQVLENLGAVLLAAGMNYSDVVSVTIYMTDMENYSRINAVYAQYFKDQPPARAAVEVVNLPKYVNVEISCIAIGTQ